MFEIFKKKENEVATINTPDIRRIYVKDLKQYLVDELERSKTMQKVIDSQEDEIERLQIEEEKYKATLILADGFSLRIKDYENRMVGLHDTIADLKKELKDSKDNVNDLTIQYSRLQLSEEQIRNSIKDEIIERVVGLAISNIRQLKGSLSKGAAISEIEYAGKIVKEQE